MNSRIVRALAGGVLILAVVLISIVLWSYSLRRQVRKQTASLRAAMQQLEQANATKDRFLAGVSHELRTPLHGIMGMAQLMEKTKLSAKQSAWLGTLKTASHQLYRVLSDLIDLSRLDSGKLSLSESSFSLNDLLMWIEPVLSEEAKVRGLDLQFSIDGNRDTVIVSDKERIAQIILNLADNAIKNTDTGGVAVRLVLEEQGSEEHCTLDIQVQDTGKGIPQDDQHRIFSAFTQLETAPGTLAPGLGLGLSIVKTITDLMNGSVNVQSTIGRGSTFSVRLPVLKGQEDSRANSIVDGDVSPSVPDHKHILIAEDEAINRLYLQQLLTKHGWKTTAASDGEEVVRKVEERRYDLIFMDLSMPKLDGFEATKRIRRIESHSGSARAPIIALTAHAYAENRQACLNAGMNGFISKPFREAALWDEIERVLQQELSVES